MHRTPAPSLSIRAASSSAATNNNNNGNHHPQHHKLSPRRIAAAASTVKTADHHQDKQLLATTHPAPTAITTSLLMSRARIFFLGVLVGVIFTRPFSVLPDLENHEDSHPHFKPLVVPSSAERQQRQSMEKVRRRSSEEKGRDDDHDDHKVVVSAAAAAVSDSTHDDGDGGDEKIVDFAHHSNVVIATKIHGPSAAKQIIQSMCLLNAAYNHRTQFDVVVFLTEPFDDQDERDLREAVHPANLKLVLDKKRLSDHLRLMTDEQRTDLLQRCQVNSTQQLFWWTRCCEWGSAGECMPLAYTWQSEFRSLHLWSEEVLQPYRYMLWFDSDAFPTKVWPVDPIAIMKRNKLKILFDNFPQGSSAGVDLRDKIRLAYRNATLCYLKLVDGHLQAKGGGCRKPRIPNIHGFFHITDLDFYRNAENMQWYQIMIGHHKFSRRWDDQLAVTIPAAMRAGDKAWDMNANNITLDIYHNSYLDGSRRWRWQGGTKQRGGGGFQTWWKENSESQFPKGRAQCHEWIRNGG